MVKPARDVEVERFDETILDQRHIEFGIGRGDIAAIVDGEILRILAGHAQIVGAHNVLMQAIAGQLAAHRQFHRARMGHVEQLAADLHIGIADGLARRLQLVVVDQRGPGRRRRAIAPQVDGIGGGQRLADRLGHAIDRSGGIAVDRQIEGRDVELAIVDLLRIVVAIDAADIHLPCGRQVIDRVQMHVDVFRRAGDGGAGAEHLIRVPVDGVGGRRRPPRLKDWK
jgi:hypothetical protein